MDFLTTSAVFSDSVDLLTQSDSQAISFGSSLHESGSVSLLTLTQIFESLKYTKAGAFPLFSHSCMYFPRNGLNCRNMEGIGQKSNVFLYRNFIVQNNGYEIVTSAEPSEMIDTPAFLQTVPYRKDQS